jgi:hypothetical protein
MVARGHVQNGVVVLDGDVQFSEGQTVTVIASQLFEPPTDGSRSHNLNDIPSIRLGSRLPKPADDNDLLGEMLEGRA